MWEYSMHAPNVWNRYIMHSLSALCMWLIHIQIRKSVKYIHNCYTEVVITHMMAIYRMYLYGYNKLDARYPTIASTPQTSGVWDH